MNFTTNLAYAHITTCLLPFFFNIFLRIEVTCVSSGILLYKKKLGLPGERPPGVALLVEDLNT
jgi:hypothetical protein